MKLKNYYLSALLFSIYSLNFAQNPSAQIANWKNDASCAYSIIHDDYGAFGMDGIWQYGDTIAANRGVRFGFGLIGQPCEQRTNMSNNKSCYQYAVDHLMANGHELINHSYVHGCAVGNAGWEPCNMSQGWGESIAHPNFSVELNQAHQSMFNGTGYNPVFYIYPFDRFSNLANNRLKELGYSGSRTGWPESFPLTGGFERNGYNGDDPANYLPDADGFFRNGVQVFDDNHSKNLNDNSQLNILNGTVNNAINTGAHTNRELHGVGDGSWGSVSINAYRMHMDFVRSRMESGEVYNAPITEINSYQLQKVKYSPNVSYNSGTETINITWNTINPSINVNVANYLNNLTHKTPITLRVNLDGLTGDWDISQSGLSVNDYTQNGNILLINVYPHLGPVQISKQGTNNLAPVIVNPIPDQELSINFNPYTIDLKTVFEDDNTSVDNLIYTVSGNTNILFSMTNGVATITSTADFTGVETITFRATDEGGLFIEDVVSFNVTDPFLLQTPFLGFPHPIPGRIQAEDFDEGPEGIAFNEEFNQWEPNPANNPYRPNHPVDIEAFGNDEFLVGYTMPGEWLAYTVEAATEGYYTIIFTVAQQQLNDPVGQLRLLLNGDELMPATPMTFTSDWYTFEEVTFEQQVFIPEGKHIIRLEIVVGNININYFDINSTVTSRKEISNEKYTIYPNPASNFIVIDGDFEQAEIFDAAGKKVKQVSSRRANITDLNAGVYYVRFNKNGQVNKLLIQR